MVAMMFRKPLPKLIEFSHMDFDELTTELGNVTMVGDDFDAPF
jgi:hypothetical protein